jgi:hypothetical protein
MAFGYRGKREWLRKHHIGGSGDGLTYGCAQIPGPCAQDLTVVFSGAEDPIAQGWEHVSVSTPRRPPNWREMCFIKALFWDAEDTVVQFHPPESAYVNQHPHCLHLWRSRDVVIPLPPIVTV